MCLGGGCSGYQSKFVILLILTFPGDYQIIIISRYTDNSILIWKNSLANADDNISRSPDKCYATLYKNNIDKSEQTTLKLAITQKSPLQVGYGSYFQLFVLSWLWRNMGKINEITSKSIKCFFLHDWRSIVA